MFSLRYVISHLVFDILSYTNKFVKNRFSAKWIFYQTSALMTTDNSVLSVHEQIFAGDIITYTTSSCHNVFNFSSFQHFCKGEVCDLKRTAEVAVKLSRSVQPLQLLKTQV